LILFFLSSSSYFYGEKKCDKHIAILESEVFDESMCQGKRSQFD
jgi:hypothetical protein